MENYVCLKTGVEADIKRMTIHNGKNILFAHNKTGLMMFSFFRTLTASRWSRPADFSYARSTLPRPHWPKTLMKVKSFNNAASSWPPPRVARLSSATTSCPSLFITIYVTICTYLTLLVIVQCCIHFTELHRFCCCYLHCICMWFYLVNSLSWSTWII